MRHYECAMEANFAILERVQRFATHCQWEASTICSLKRRRLRSDLFSGFKILKEIYWYENVRFLPSSNPTWFEGAHLQRPSRLQQRSWEILGNRLLDSIVSSLKYHFSRNPRIICALLTYRFSALIVTPKLFILLLYTCAFCAKHE